MKHPPPVPSDTHTNPQSSSTAAATAKRSQRVIEKQPRSSTTTQLHPVKQTRSNVSEQSVKEEKKEKEEPLAASVTEISGHKSKRTKERTIQEIIEKVSTWRKLYNGVFIPNEETGE